MFTDWFNEILIEKKNNYNTKDYMALSGTK